MPLVPLIFLLAGLFLVRQSYSKSILQVFISPEMADMAPDIRIYNEIKTFERRFSGLAHGCRLGIAAARSDTGEAAGSAQQQVPGLSHVGRCGARVADRETYRDTLVKPRG